MQKLWEVKNINFCLKSTDVSNLNEKLSENIYLHKVHISKVIHVKFHDLSTIGSSVNIRVHEIVFLAYVDLDLISTIMNFRFSQGPIDGAFFMFIPDMFKNHRAKFHLYTNFDQGFRHFSLSSHRPIKKCNFSSLSLRETSPIL